MTNAFLLRDLGSMLNSLTPNDMILFIRTVVLQANGHAVINDLNLKPNAQVQFALMSQTTVAAGAGTMDTSGLAVIPGSVCVATADTPASGNAPAIDIPGADIGTHLALVIVKQSDLVKVGYPLQ